MQFNLNIILILTILLKLVKNQRSLFNSGILEE